MQAWLFDPDKLAPTYPESMITRPFPFNAYYGIDEVRHVDEESFRLEVSGLVADKRQWRLDELRRMAQIDQVTRHICVEGWSAIGKWGGVPFSAFLKRVGADLARATWASSAPTTTTPASTCPLLCMRRPFWR